MFGELKQRSVLWDEPRAAAERVGVNYFMALFCRNYFFFLLGVVEPSAAECRISAYVDKITFLR